MKNTIKHAKHTFVKKTQAAYGFWRELAFMLALMAFTFRALIPVGFMPETHAGSGTLITICSGYGESQLRVDADGKPVKEHTNPNEQPCGFSVNLAMLDNHAPVLAVAQTFAETVLPVVSDRFVGSHKKSNHPSRAPPVA